MSDPTPTDRVKEEIEIRRKEEERLREEKKNTVAERMKKMAGAQGMSPGFSTAELGAQIASVTKDADRNASGGIKVKEVAKKVDEQD